MARRTKIVATIGPASADSDSLAKVIEAGVDVIRLNLSHGTIEQHLALIRLVRTTAERSGRHVGVLADLPGPKVRAGRFCEGGIMLATGDRLEIRPGHEPSDANVVYVDHATLIDDLAAGDRVILGDGSITLRVTTVGPTAVSVVVVSGGLAQGRPGVHLPSEQLRLATPTPHDLVLAEQVAAAGVEFVAVSFVRSASDMLAVRSVVGDRADLIAKIETSTAVANLDGILEVSDAIMVARGDLGIDCPLEDVPHLQKSIIRKCVEYGIPVITATQMLESMITAPSPTRAEVSDVANAVFDGTDALMLSGETAIGHDPALVVSTMATIAERAESEAGYRRWADHLGRIQRTTWDSHNDRITAAITHAASQAAHDAGVTAILCCTQSGRTAKTMARFRPAVKLLALSPNVHTVDALTLAWGVEPVAVGTYASTDEMVFHAVDIALRLGHVSIGDTVLVLAGSPDRPAGIATDVLRIVRVK